MISLGHCNLPDHLALVVELARRMPSLAATAFDTVCSEAWWGDETINLISGQPGRTNEVLGTSYLMVTDQGVYLNGQNGP